MHLLAQEDGRRSAELNPIDVFEPVGQRTPEPESEPAGAHVVEDTAGPRHQIRRSVPGRRDESRLHRFSPESAASTSSLPSLIALSVSIRLDASKLEFGDRLLADAMR